MTKHETRADPALAIERGLTVDGSPAAAWKVISDMAGYADHVAGLSETTIVSGAQLGAERRCVDSSGDDWMETCVAWVPGSSFSVQVDVDSYPGKFRALFSAFLGTWTVDVDAGRTVIGIRFDARLRAAGRLLRRQIRRRIEADLDDILASYAVSIDG